MREIKFRGWDEKEKKMYSPKELADLAGLWFEQAEDGSLEISLIEDSFGCRRQFKKMQYTGLKDKNGVEIYEGDIVERRRERGLVDFNSKNYAEIPGWNLLLYQYVPYQKEGWIYQEKEDMGELPAIEYYYGCPPDKSWEVVGNIFEGVDNK